MDELTPASPVMEPTREITLTLIVTVPATVGENDVEQAINAALDEPPCEWGEWTVGAAVITGVVRSEREHAADDDL